MRRPRWLLALALAPALACASKSAGPSVTPPPPPAAESAEPARPGDPVVTLLAPGNEPRAPLRYRVRAGYKAVQMMDMDMAMAMSIDENALPAMKTPPVHMTFAIDVPEVAPDGTNRAVCTITSVDVRARPDDRPELVEKLKSGLAGMVGLTTDMRLTSRGFARDVKINVPPSLPANMQSMLQAVRNITEQAGAIFPAEPVGQGARWRVESMIDTAGIKLRQAVIVTLEWRDDHQAYLVMTIEQTAAPQPIVNPELPAGATASLERHTGKGGGRVHVELGSRIVNGRIAMKASSVTAVVMSQSRSRIGLDMDMDVTFAPGPTN